MSSPRATLGQSESEHAAASRANELYWRDYELRYGPLAGIRVADELRRQVIAQRPDWPTPAERADDHAAHLRALDALARVTSRAG